MRTGELLLSLMRAESLPALFREAARGVQGLLGAEGAYVLRLEAGRWRVVGAAGAGEGALGLRLPREWEPPQGSTPPPGPLGFSPDGKERRGLAARRGNLALVLEGEPAQGEGLLDVVLEALALRTERLAALSTLDLLLEFGKRLRRGGLLEREVREALEVLLHFTGLAAGALFRIEEGLCRPWVAVGEYPPEYLFLHQKEPVPWGEGATRLLRESPRGLAVVPDYQAYPHALPAFQGLGLRTAALVLLERQGEAYGILALASFGRPVEVSPETERLLLVARDELEAYLERRLQVEGTLEAIARILEGLD